jgi:uncharacterized protein
MAEIPLLVDGQKIDFTLFTTRNTSASKPAFLFLHGWTSRKDRHVLRAEKINTLGVTSMAISFRGHGDSEGDFDKLSRADHLKDALAAYDFLSAQPGVDKSRVAVFGSSYGGYTASLLTAERNIRYLALWDPALYLDNNFDVPTKKLIDQDPDVFKKVVCLLKIIKL